MMAEPRRLAPEELERWLQAAAAELGLDAAEVPIATILDVARDVAHDVARPAAPLSTFLLGLAVGRADAATLNGLADKLSVRARQWADAAEQ